MRFQPLTLASTATQDLSNQLQFTARAVHIDNFTNQWLLVRGIPHYIQPYMADCILPLDGPQAADVTIAAPFNFSQLAPIPGENAFLTYFDTPMPYNPGTIVRAIGGPSQIVPAQSLQTWTVFGSALSTGALLAGTEKTLAALWVPNPAFPGGSKNLTLRRVYVSVDSVSAATILEWRVRRWLSGTPPSGGTLVAAQPSDPGTGGFPVSQSKFMTLPTATPGLVAATVARRIPYGIVAGSTSDLFRDMTKLHEPNPLIEQDPIARQTLAVSPDSAGFAITVLSTAAATIVANVFGVFTEAPELAVV